MALELQTDCSFSGPALPLPFVKFNLEAELIRLRLLPRSTGDDAAALDAFWPTYRAHLRQLISQGGPQRVRNQVIDPLTACPLLGYTATEAADEVRTREGLESGGYFLLGPDGARLRFWVAGLNEDLDAPARRGEAYRFSHARIASRVLLAAGERLGILTNGADLRLLICDPARLDSHVTISLDGSWKRSREIPYSLRLFIALAKPEGVRAIPELVEKARLQQAKVTKDLRAQARLAVEEFIQAALDAPENQQPLAAFPDQSLLARQLWHEGLITVYRLLFVLKLESTDDPAKCFSFASGSLWRNTFSPGVALAPLARAVLDRGEQTGTLLESGLRCLFRMLETGLQCTELNIKPMGGSLFAPHATPILYSLRWPEQGVARLLDRLLWTTPRRGVASRERVHYGPLDVEDLGRVYEALLELDPGISAEPMCRLRRAKLEVVLPAAQGERYRPATPPPKDPSDPSDQSDPSDDDSPAEEDTPTAKTKVEWIQEIPPGRFYLRVGLGRKSTGSFYTPHSFVRFLVQETLGPLVARVSPAEDPNPAAILKLKVVDKAMGSGHFLVEACRYLADALYETCRRCDDLARAANQRAAALRTAGNPADAEREDATAAEFIRQIEHLPDPDDELLRYLPSRVVEGGESGFSQQKATALCRRLVAVHCLYGVDKNPLAVELAKLALWIECHAEGLPLTFLDHRLVVGDSLTGPFFTHLLTYPGTRQPLDDLFTRNLTAKLTAALADALQHIRALEATVGTSVTDLETKQAAKSRLDQALAPFKILAAAWSGGVMLGKQACDDSAYAALAKAITDGTFSSTLPTSEISNRESQIQDLSSSIPDPRSPIHDPTLLRMIAKGLGLPTVPDNPSDLRSLTSDLSKNAIPALSFDLTFPEVFYPDGDPANSVGFNADLGNPPWDRMLPMDKEFFASFDFGILRAATKRERSAIQDRLLGDPTTKKLHDDYLASFREQEEVLDQLFKFQVVEVNGERTIGKQDAFRAFMERGVQVLQSRGLTGVIVPSAFHANEGATGVRRLYFHQMALRCCYSFENRRKLFEIDSRFKFAAIVAEKGSPTTEFSCAFYLHDDEWLFQHNRERPPLCYSIEFVERTGGDYLSLLEIRTDTDLNVAETCYARGVLFSTACKNLSVEIGRELNSSDDSPLFTPTDELVRPGEDPRDPKIGAALLAQGFLVVHEGRTFHQFTDLWDERNRYCVAITKLSGRPFVHRNPRFYRLSYRKISASTNERTAIFALLPPGSVGVDYSPCEQTSDRRANASVLALLALCNSFSADFCLRLYVSSATVNYFFLARMAVPSSYPVAFLAHSALRLTSNHAGYAPLWREQLGDAWRESGPAFTWPVLAGDAARWAVRAAIDAVVAQAYGLTRAQYAHILTTFSHSSHKAAPHQCLAAFDELQQIGLEAFTRQHDPYHDIPLNENLPQPVIDLPMPQATTVQDQPAAYHAADLFDFQTTAAPTGSGNLLTKLPGEKTKQPRKER